MNKTFLIWAALLGAAAPAAAQPFGARALAIFDDADTNHDGKVSRAEFSAAREARFDRMDRNHDGAVSRDDFGRLLRFRPKAGERLDRWIASADINHDGKVSLAEFRAMPMHLFDLADTNHDGQVDKAELAKLRTRADLIKDDGGLP
jgi:Ca2+-binding EF-hand superfamily protein